MRIHVLGPVSVIVDGCRHTLPRSQVRGMLALLALHAGQPVSADAAIEALWGGRAPASARNRVQDFASTIRRVLDAGVPNSVGSGRFGYVLRVPDETVDALALIAGVRLARGFTDAGDAIARYRSALALWTGEPLADATGAFVDAARTRLWDQYLAAVESVTAAELARGEHAGVASELAPLVARHPLRERLVENLMLAHHRGGDRAAALAVYRRYRAGLCTTLGLEPGAQAQRLHRAILASDPALSPATPPPTSRVRPAQLPCTPSALVGRTGELVQLAALARPGRITVISGRGGVGKTALAVAWAHAAEARFPDGQLYLNLHGFSPGSPVSAGEATARFLRALGVPGEQVPIDVDEAASRLRTELSGRRMLMLLDNAADAAQVRPLLPGGSTVTVLITSRDRLSGLAATHGACQVLIDSLDACSATELLREQLRARMLTEEAAAHLAALCGRLPLALRIAAARLRDEPQLTVEGYAAVMARGARLTELAIAGDPDAAVRATFDLSYTRLDAAQQRMFRLLAFIPGGDFDLLAAAELAGLTDGSALELLRGLVAVHLVDASNDDRYAMHDLLKAYAIERAAADEPDGYVRQARDRLFAWYLATATAASRLISPEVPLLPGEPADTGWTRVSEALSWMETEQHNLVAAALAAADAGLIQYGWQLPDRLRTFLWHTGRRAEWRATAAHALAAACSVADESAQAAAQLNLGWYEFAHGTDTAARDHYTAAVHHATAAGWVEARVAALNGLARANRDLGRLTAARDHLRTALVLERELGRGPDREALIRSGLASVCLLAGLLDEAHEHAIQATVHSGSTSAQAAHTVILGDVLLARGEHATAATRYAEALATFDRLGHRAGQIKCHTGLGAATRERRLLGEARTHLDRALALARESGDGAAEAGARHELARLRMLCGRPADALAELDQAAALPLGPATRIAVRTDRSRALAALGRCPKALAEAQQALLTAHGTEYALLIADAQAAVAAVTPDLRRP